jgi:hypothetical protein
MRAKNRACQAKIDDSRERIVLTLELPRDSVYSATFSGRGKADPTRLAVKVESAPAATKRRR